jgi:hypothetical protein
MSYSSGSVSRGKSSQFTVASRTMISPAFEKAMREAKNAEVRLRAALDSVDEQGSKAWFQTCLLSLQKLSILSKDISQGQIDLLEDALTDMVVGVFGEDTALEWAEEVIKTE